MKKAWIQFAERIDALSLRERVWVFAGAMVVLVAFSFELYIDGEMQREKRLSTGVRQMEAETRTLQVQITALVQARSNDPDREIRERLARLKVRIAGVNASIAAEERKFTAPEQMKVVVEEMLARNRGVRLVDLKTLRIQSVADLRLEEGGAAKPAPAKPAAESGSARLVFRHGMDVTVSGTYLDLLAYLGDLERLPTQLYWGALDLAVDEYPRVTMKFTVYTLSLDRAWMSV